MNTHPNVMNYGWTVPVGGQESHYVMAARLVGRAGWLGRTACGHKAGGHVPLQAVPGKKVCTACSAKAGGSVGG